MRRRTLPLLACLLAAPLAGQAPGELAPPPALLESVRWYTGVAGEVDDVRARALLEEAAATGDPLARMWVARCWSRGRMGYPRDEARARARADSLLPAIQERARAGVLEAVFLMGTVYDEALGVPHPDAEEAARWYRRAAEGGHVLAQHNLGNAYRAGRGVAANDAQAVRWWRPAAEAGDAIAQLRLGEMYEHGRGVRADTAEALRWYRDAAARGNQAAADALRRLSAPGHQGGRPSYVEGW